MTSQKFSVLRKGKKYHTDITHTETYTGTHTQMLRVREKEKERVWIASSFLQLRTDNTVQLIIYEAENRRVTASICPAHG